MIPEAAVEAAMKHFPPLYQSVVEAALESAAPHIRAQVLHDAVDAFPLETITAPDNAVVWLRRRAEQIEATL